MDLKKLAVSTALCTGLLFGCGTSPVVNQDPINTITSVESRQTAEYIGDTLVTHDVSGKITVTDGNLTVNGDINRGNVTVDNGDLLLKGSAADSDIKMIGYGEVDIRGKISGTEVQAVKSTVLVEDTGDYTIINADSIEGNRIGDHNTMIAKEYIHVGNIGNHFAGETEGYFRSGSIGKFSNIKAGDDIEVGSIGVGGELSGKNVTAGIVDSSTITHTDTLAVQGTKGNTTFIDGEGNVTKGKSSSIER